MPVFDYVQQYGTFLCVKRDKEQVVKNQKLTAFDFLEFGFKAVPDFCTFSAPRSFAALPYRVRMPRLQAS